MLVENESFSENNFNLFLNEISYEIKDYDNNSYTIDQLIKKLKEKDRKFQVLGDFLLLNKNN